MHASRPHARAVRKRARVAEMVFVRRHATPATPVVVALCNDSHDYQGNSAIVQVVRAQMMAASLRSHGSNVTLVAMVHGMRPSALARLRRAGFNVDDRSSTEPSTFALRPIFTEEPGFKWPRLNQSRFVQHRPDGMCTSFKWLAWQLVHLQALFLCDTDVVFQEDPWPWMRARLDEDEYFHAPKEVLDRNYEGLNTHVVWLRPNRDVFRMLADAGKRGNYIPYTNSDQDVVEALFTRHRDLPMPLNVHTKLAFCTCRSVVGFHPHVRTTRPAWADRAAHVVGLVHANVELSLPAQSNGGSVSGSVWRVGSLTEAAHRLCPDERKLVHADSLRCFDEESHASSNGRAQVVRLLDSMTEGVASAFIHGHLVKKTGEEGPTRTVVESTSSAVTPAPSSSTTTDASASTTTASKRTFDARTREGRCTLPLGWQGGKGSNSSCASRSLPHAQPTSDLPSGALIWVIVRGDTFRAHRSDVQSAIAASTRRHVLTPLRLEYPTAQLHVHLCVRKHRVAEYNNSWYLDELTRFPGATGSLQEHEPDSSRTQIQADLWLECLNRVPSAVSVALVLRADLFFVAPVNVSALHTSRFLFQWKLWHDCATHEMADQMQCIGGRLLPRIRHAGRRDHAAINACWWATLHNLFNFLEVVLGKELLGYLNFYPEELCDSPAPGAAASRCALRGNPTSSSGAAEHDRDAHWYRYDRHLVESANATCVMCEGE